jgi:hypothetical protein
MAAVIAVRLSPAAVGQDMASWSRDETSRERWIAALVEILIVHPAADHHRR